MGTTRKLHLFFFPMLLAGPILLSLLSAPDVRPLVVWSGSDSKIEVARTELVASEWDWIRVWHHHKGLGKGFAQWDRSTKDRPGERRYDYYNEAGIPEIDFRSHLVVAVFGGRVHNTAGYSVIETRQEGDTVVLRVLPRYYSRGTILPPGHTPGTHVSEADRPFVFVLLPRVGRSLRLEQGVVEGKGEPVTKFRLIKSFTIPTSP